jgi:dipeptidyl aminopeptidase/acylaminoacyl peptidase
VATADGSGTPRVLSRAVGLYSSPLFSPDGEWVAWIETTGTRTRDIWRVAVAGGEPRQVTRSMGRIDPARLPVPEEVTFLAPDHLPIPTMIIRPAGFREDGRYPVLVRLHGHPGQWNHGFEVMDQYFADRGYIVIKPNPRGSRGFGQGFHDLHIADYGGAEFQDVMAVIPYLRSLGYADMDRLVTEGGSGGGYMSFVIATEAPTAFRAQAIRAPVSDWGLIAIDRFAASGRAWTATREPRREREEFGGSQAEIPDEYHRRSPIHFVENVEVPQLLMHGLRDSAVLPRQSTVWVDRMRELGKDALITYVEYPDEDHSLLRYQDTTRDRLQRMERFFAEHLGLPAADRD